MRVAATLVVLQTAGYVLDEEVFEAALKKAKGSGDISGVLALGHLSAAQRGR